MYHPVDITDILKDKFTVNRAFIAQQQHIAFDPDIYIALFQIVRQYVYLPLYLSLLLL